MKIVVQTFHDQKPHGDRATTLTPCKRYCVLLENDQGTTFPLREFDQFDAFNCSVGPSLDNEVNKFIRGLSAMTGFKVEKMEFHLETTIRWRVKK